MKSISISKPCEDPWSLVGRNVIIGRKTHDCRYCWYTCTQWVLGEQSTTISAKRNVRIPFLDLFANHIWSKEHWIPYCWIFANSNVSYVWHGCIMYDLSPAATIITLGVLGLLFVAWCVHQGDHELETVRKSFMSYSTYAFQHRRVHLYAHRVHARRRYTYLEWGTCIIHAYRLGDPWGTYTSTLWPRSYLHP